jgi:Sulfotransferase domain
MKIPNILNCIARKWASSHDSRGSSPMPPSFRLPTSVGTPKIFGIGLAKTGTTSLHFALELLGFRSAHASSVLCDVINQEARDHRPMLSTLESQYDAFLDWPISYFYPHLDCRFPGSKFILTLRNAKARYSSARRHIEEDQAREKRDLSYAWTSLVPKKAFIHEDERYTAEVTSYFENRSQDLLVIRIADGEGWTELCKFLGVPVPSVPFPHHRSLGSHETQFLRQSRVASRPVHLDLEPWEHRSSTEELASAKS